MRDVALEVGWFILIENQKEGPFSYEDLRRDERLTPDTLVWRMGYDKWLPIRNVPELKDLFKESEPQPSPDEEDETEVVSQQLKRENGVIALSYDPFHFWFWILVGVILILYIFHKLGWFES